MDDLAFVAMTGAVENAIAQAVQANNLANVRTTGFRADFTQARSMQLFGDSFPTRIYSMSETPGTDFTPGQLTETGRPLDVAVEGNGFITVIGSDGEEAYTRAGDFILDDLGRLQTAFGMPIMGDGGPIVIPPFEKLEIGSDGTISIRGQGQGPEVLTQVNRIKLVNPILSEIVKNEDGLFRRRDGLIEAPTFDVSLISGFLETSNVNAVAAMTEILALSRQFELQVKMIRTAESNDEAATTLLQVN